MIPFAANAIQVSHGKNSKNLNIICQKPKNIHANRASKKIESFLRIYKNSIVKSHLNRIVLCGHLKRYNLDWIRGTYNVKNKTIWLEVDDHKDVLFILHHEFSSLLMHNYKKINANQWIKHNNGDYIKSWQKQKWDWQPNDTLRRNGCLYSYSQQALEDDFNVMSALYLAGVPSYSRMLKDASKFHRIKEKLNIVKRYYKEILIAH